MSRPTTPRAPPSFAALVQSFFTEHLTQQRAMSPRTVATYRDGFVLFLGFATVHLHKQPTAMKLQDASPNWSEWTCGRKTCVRFLPLKTAEATQTFAHMSRFAASTLAAIGTQCADENTPINASTLTSFRRRSASLIATSALDWASAYVATIL